MNPGYIGIDEAGRGPLAGPVYAAAVLFAPDTVLPAVRDSKRLSAAARERLEIEIKAVVPAWAVASASVEEIDGMNILHASLLAMRRAFEALRLTAAEVLVDGNQVPPGVPGAVACVRGDDTWPAIAAASILAKVERDRVMARLDGAYPGYGFAGHKGYGTAVHLQALEALGPCAEHRRSFAPVRRLCAAPAD